MNNDDKHNPVGHHFYQEDTIGEGARFASQDDLKEDGYGPRGRLSFGYARKQRTDKGNMEVSYNGEKMGLLFAPPRSGKGVTLCRMALDHPGSLVCFSPRGEEAAVAYHYRKHVLGQEVILIDPLDIVASYLGVESDSLDLMDLLDPNSPLFFEDAFTLADGFSLQGADTDGFWHNAALDFSTTGVMAAASDPIDGKPMSLPEAVALFSMQKEQLVERLVGAYRKPLGGDDAQGPVHILKKGLAQSDVEIVAQGVVRIIDAEERTRNNIFSTIHANARAFQSQVIRNALSKSTFDLNALPHGNMTIFLVIPTYVAPLVASIIKLIMTTCLYIVGRSQVFPKPPVLTLWDETFLCGVCRSLIDSIGIQSGDGNQIVTCWHDVSQIQQLYPNNWESFITTAGFISIFGNNDPATQKYFSEYAGDMHTQLMSYQTARMTAMAHIPEGLHNGHDRVSRAALISPNRIKTMKPWEALFFPAHSNPTIGYKAPYFLDRKYRDARGKPLFASPPRYAGNKVPRGINFEAAGDDLPNILKKVLSHG